jgi:signal transduction histidine kinase
MPRTFQISDMGVAAALDAQARKAPIPVSVEAGGTGRYPQETEAAVYFCTLEALHNAAKHADPSRAIVRLSESIAELAFKVADDGRGFDPSTTRQGTACRAWPTGSTHSAATSKSIQVRPGHQDQRPSTR